MGIYTVKVNSIIEQRWYRVYNALCRDRLFAEPAKGFFQIINELELRTGLKAQEVQQSFEYMIGKEY